MENEMPEEKAAPANRLCSEIQLFDLCELDSCRHRSGRFCTNEELLARFEAIREEDADTLVYDEEEMEGEDDDFDEVTDEFEDGEYADED